LAQRATGLNRERTQQITIVQEAQVSAPENTAPMPLPVPYGAAKARKAQDKKPFFGKIKLP